MARRELERAARGRARARVARPERAHLPHVRVAPVLVVGHDHELEQPRAHGAAARRGERDRHPPLRLGQVRGRDLDEVGPARARAHREARGRVALVEAEVERDRERRERDAPLEGELDDVRLRAVRLPVRVAAPVAEELDAVAGLGGGDGPGGEAAELARAAVGRERGRDCGAAAAGERAAGDGGPRARLLACVRRGGRQAVARRRLSPVTPADIALAL